MPIISKPLHIGAADLLKGVEHSHYGVLFFLVEKRRKRKKWKQRYMILSEGCLYIYKNKNSKEPKESYSLKHFEYVQESEPEDGEDICFCLHYKNGNPPKVFSCDTPETREEWIKKLRSEMADVQSTFCLSADSGFGSGGTIPTFGKSDTYETEELDETGRKYDKVDERLFQPDTKDTQTQRNVKHGLYSEDNDYEPVNCPRPPKPNVCKRVNDIELTNQGSSEVLGAIEKKQQIKLKPNILMEELKSKLISDHRGLSSGVGECGKDTQFNTSLSRRDSSTSVASSFVSVKGGYETSDNVISLSSQSVVQAQGKIEGQNVQHDADYEDIKDLCTFAVRKRETDIERANQGLAGEVKKTTLETKPNSLIDELTSKLKTDHKGLASVGEDRKPAHISPLRRDSMTSVASSFLSIQGGHEISDEIEALPSQSVQMQVCMYKTDKNTDKNKEEKATVVESQDTSANTV